MNSRSRTRPTASEIRQISSVAAALSYMPTDPDNTEDIILCSDSDYSDDISPGGVGYQWDIFYDPELTNPFSWSSSDCNSGLGCSDCGVVIPAETFPAANETYWVRLTRSGDLFTGERSVDGLSWQVVDTVNVSMSQQVYIGLALTSHHKKRLNVATFDNVSLSGDLGIDEPQTLQKALP